MFYASANVTIEFSVVLDHCEYTWTADSFSVGRKWLKIPHFKMETCIRIDYF